MISESEAWLQEGEQLACPWTSDSDDSQCGSGDGHDTHSSDNRHNQWAEGLAEPPASDADEDCQEIDAWYLEQQARDEQRNRKLLMPCNVGMCTELPPKGFECDEVSSSQHNWRRWRLSWCCC